MLKKALKCKQIQIFSAVIAVIVVVILVMPLDTVVRYAQKSVEAWEDEAHYEMIHPSKGSASHMTYTVNHISGKYKLVGNDKGWIVENTNGKVLYETDYTNPKFTNKTGYLIEYDKAGRALLIDFRSGETVWRGADKERIVKYDANSWIVEVDIDDEFFDSRDYYYLLDENFNVAGGDKIFKDIDSLDDDRIQNFISVTMFEVFDYKTRKAFETTEGEFSAKDCVIDGDGNIVFEDDTVEIWGVEGDTVMVCYGTNKYKYISLEGDNKGQVVEVNDDEN